MTTRQKRRAIRARTILKARRGEYSIGTLPLACRKLRYSSASEAKSAVRRAVGSGTCRDKQLMGHYWCQKCDAWHIGHDRSRAEARP